jgi:flagellar biosynthesis protein FlhG
MALGTASLGSEAATRGRSARLIPFGGGKGGVGKTFLVANLAVSLARLGYKVIAVDADLEGANLHTCLGMREPPSSLADYVAGRQEDVAKLVLDTAIPHLSLLAGTHSNAAAPQPTAQRRVELLAALSRLRADFVLVDLGAGTHPAVMDYFMIGDDGVLVIAPEPTSVENAYAFLRAAFYRRLRLAMLSLEARKLVTLAMDQKNERGIRTPFDLLREIELADPEEGARFAETMRAFRPQLVINEARRAEDIRLGFSIRSVCRKYFGIEAEYLGYVNHDEAALRAVRARQPLVIASPRSDAAVYVERMARKLAARRDAERSRSKPHAEPLA